MRHIGFTGQISKGRIEDLLNEMKGTGAPKLVSIDSPGGSFEFFSVLGPALARVGYTSLGLNVRSAAIVLQLLGRERLATPESVFFFHEVRSIVGSVGEVTVCDLEEFLDRERELQRMKGATREVIEEWRRRMRIAQQWMLSFIQEQTGLLAGTFSDLLRNEVTLSAREATRYGIVHRIVSEDELRSM